MRLRDYKYVYNAAAHFAAAEKYPGPEGIYAELKKGGMAAFDAQPVPFGFSSVVRPLVFEVGEQGMSLQDAFHGVGRKGFEHEVVQPGRVGGAAVPLRRE